MKKSLIPLFAASFVVPSQFAQAEVATVMPQGSWLNTLTVSPLATPKANISINTEGYIKEKTREDWPYSVKIDVTGFSNSAEAKNSEKYVTINKSFKYLKFANDVVDYSAPVTSFAGFPAPVSSSPGSANYSKSNLQFSTATGFAGEEYYKVTSLEEALEGITIPSGTLASGKLEVWPRPTGSLSISGGASSFQTDAPPVNITVQNRYPGSITFVQIYKGAKQASAGLKGELLVDSEFNTTLAYSAATETKSVANWYPKVTSRGSWNLELISMTRLKDGANFEIATLDGAAGAATFGKEYSIQTIPTGNIAGVEAGTYLVERGGYVAAEFPEVTIEPVSKDITVRASVTTD